MNQLREALLDPEAYLMKSPPIAPARSLAPGEAPVNAATVIAYAAAQQNTRIGTGAELPLPAMPSQAKTMIATEQPRHTAAHVVPEMQPPAATKMNTMRIATPLGYSSRPPRRMWPIVLVVGLLLGLGGGAFAVAWFGRKATGTAVAEAGTPAGSAVAVTPTRPDAAAVPPPPAPVVVDAAVAVVAKPDAAAKTASVVIDSSPQGAEVIGPDKKVLGKTPARLTLPVSDLPQTFELKLSGYRHKTEKVVVTGNTVVNIPLERAPVVIQQPTHRGSAHHSGADDLERP
jgi:hypothetical protein